MSLESSSIKINNDFYINVENIKNWFMQQSDYANNAFKKLRKVPGII